MTSATRTREADGRLTVEEDERVWRLDASTADRAARMRSAFRRFLERTADPASDVDAAESIFGEMLASCVRHAPGRVRVTFTWDDSRLVVADSVDRLQTWPFSDGDPRSEATHHGFAILRTFSSGVALRRDAAGGTRASVVLPVLPADR